MSSMELQPSESSNSTPPIIQLTSEAQSNESSQSQIKPTPTSFANVYCGAVCIIHSFLSLQELITLTSICHYHRRIVCGLIDPTGRGNITHLHWDVLANLSKGTPLGFTVPQFESYAEGALTKHYEQRNLVSLSNDDDDSFYSVVPAPRFSSNVSSRTVQLPCRMSSEGEMSQNGVDRNLFFLSSTVMRHVTDLIIPFRIDQYHAKWIATRFPHIRSLSFRLHLLDEHCQGPSRNMFQFTPHLRSLTMRFENAVIRHSRSELCLAFPNYELSSWLNKIIVFLPTLCPLIEELVLDVPMFAHTNLSALTSLSHLTKLTLVNRSKTHECVIREYLPFRELTHIKFLKFEHFTPCTMDMTVPINGATLEYLIFGRSRTVSRQEVEIITARAPNLRISDIDLHQWWCPKKNATVTHYENLLKFRSLETFYLNVQTTPHRWFFEADATNAPTCLDGLVNKITSVLSQLNQLRNLTVVEFRSPHMSHGFRVNQSYFAATKLNLGFVRSTRNEDAADAAAFPVSHKNPFPHGLRQYGISHPHTPSSLLVYSDAELNLLTPQDLSMIHLHQNSIFRLAARMPQLISLTISGTAARELPSLSFVSQLPQLESLSISNAEYLPLESVYDLRAVSKSLLKLRIANCFPFLVNMPGQGTHLLYDVLQPFQLSYPVTRVVTIKFRHWPKKPGITADQQRISLKFDDEGRTPKAQPDLSPFAFDRHAQCIPPRLECWHHIHFPPSSTSSSAAAAAGRDSEERFKSDGIVAFGGPFILPRDVEDLEFKVIFDSFTACAPEPAFDDPDSKPLEMKLLPKLLYCEIIHREPAASDACTFVFDRRKHPTRVSINRFEEVDDYLSWKDKVLSHRRSMLNVYGIDLNAYPELKELNKFKYDQFFNDTWAWGPIGVGTAFSQS